ncbi:MAG: cupredoxin domain-containing protein [Actinomycetota bacterium]
MSDQPPHAGSPRPALPPVAYPLLAFVFGGILVFSLSRVLLAVSKAAAPVIGLLVAINVLVAAALIAYGGRVRRRPASFPLLVVSGIVVIAVGLVAAGLEGPVEEETPTEGPAAPTTIQLAAKDLKFDKTELSFPAGSAVEIVFANEDAGVQHNVSVFSEQEPAIAVFTGEIFAGVATRTYSFTAPGEPGQYAFRCDVHPTEMTGTVAVTAEGGGAGEPGGGAGGGVSVVAKGLAFQPTEVTAPGGGQVTISLDNQDSGLLHNIHVFRGEDATAPSLFAGPIITGPAKQEYSFAAPPPGAYFFHCDVHPNMTGTLNVT